MSKIILCKSRQKVEVGVGGGGREAQNVYILNFQRQTTRCLAAELGWKMYLRIMLLDEFPTSHAVSQPSTLNQSPLHPTELVMVVQLRACTGWLARPQAGTIY